MDQFPEGFELEPLLAPIAGERAVGIDIREDYSPQSLYYRLRDARAEARAAERHADASGEADAPTPPQWRTIRELGRQVLTERSKDLEVAAWLTESLIRSDDLVGLCAGARLIAGLAEAYWDDLYPMPDEDGMATRVAPVLGLNGAEGNGTLIQALNKTVLFERTDGTPVALWQYDDSVKVMGFAEASRREARIAAGTVPFDALETEARAYGAARFTALRERAAAALAAWRAMSEVLDAKAGSDAPTTRAVTQIVERIIEIADRYGPAAGPDAKQPDTETRPPGGGGGVVVTSGAGAGRALNTREDALRMLSDVADFFRRTEPQSPLAYTLDDAVRRGRMSLPDLLAEIVPDGGTRKQILSSLGIRPSDE